MKTARQFGIAFALIAVVGSLGVLLLSDDSGSVRAAETDADGTAPEPVEEDMHEFMEYVFQPTYRRLKAAMAEEPADNNAWKAIKADSLILAEGGNLLLFRTPEEDGDSWDEISVAVRESGAALYTAAREKNYESAREHYTTMLERCNSCHDDFAGGEHQLTP